MLKQRIITALTLTPFVIWGVFSLPAFYFALFIMLLVGLSSWEWAHLSRINNVVFKSIFTVASLGSLILLLWYLDISEENFYALLLVSILWWLYRIVLVITFRGSNVDTEVNKTIDITAAMSVIVSLIIPFYSLIYLRNVYNFHGYLFYLLMLIWSVDVFAYFSGKYFGKKKLAPHVSPGKTWEGVYGAFGATLVASVIGSYSFGLSLNESLLFFVLSFIVVIISIFGDLSESLYKRQNGIKDSGNLLPGHGGILDRVDSLVAAAPFYIIGLSVLGLLS